MGAGTARPSGAEPAPQPKEGSSSASPAGSGDGQPAARRHAVTRGRAGYDVRGNVLPAFAGKGPPQSAGGTGAVRHGISDRWHPVAEFVEHMEIPDMSATRTALDPADLYWRDIKNAAPLSRQREVELFTRVHQGDEGARQELVTANLRFVVSVAHGYINYGMSLVELISEGNIGLMEAVRRFDETRGVKFITYAIWWIRQGILRALGEYGRAARLPMSQINDRVKVKKHSDLLTQSLGRSPTSDEIAATAAISPQRVQTALDVGQHALSLDAPVFGNESASLVSALPAEQEGVDELVQKTEMERALHACLEVLDARECRIIRAYFGLGNAEPQTLEEIGDAFGITRERVRQLRNRALNKLRHHGGDALAELSAN